MERGWTIMRLEELCQVTSSKRIYAKELVPSGVPFLKSTEIIQKVNGQDHSSLLYISEERFQQIVDQTGALEAGDVLLTSRGTLGIPYVVRAADRFHFADGNLTWFRNFHELDSRYLSYFFLSPLGKAELAKCVIGSSQAAYTIATLKKIEIALPPLPVQRQIVGILSAYDELIENNQRRIRILEDMARSLYREWFVHFRYPGHESVPLADSPLGQIPQGWEVKSLGDVATTFRGRSYRSVDLADEGGIPFINLKCLDRDGGFRRTGLKRYVGEFKEAHLARKGDIVMAVTDMTQERRIVARAAVVPSLENEFGVFSMDLVRIEPKGNMPKPFLYSFLRHSTFADEVKQHANGANVLHLSPERITDFRFPVPPVDLMGRFIKFVAPSLEQMDLLQNQTENLRHARDLLLPRLLSGKVHLLPEEVA